VLDAGQLVQLAEAAELTNRPATARVAALTGANVLDGTATPTPNGSAIRLATGGELVSAQRASGSVRVAVQPWELELCDPASTPLTDLVVSVRDDHGRLLVRLTRFSVQIRPDRNDGPVLAEGQQVGLRAAPDNVRLLSDGKVVAGKGQVVREFRD
jgi:ABC-type Fe3+/spermidine/putrescine transport system ATPase subunit